jgi:hypothetical protein
MSTSVSLRKGSDEKLCSSPIASLEHVRYHRGILAEAICQEDSKQAIMTISTDDKEDATCFPIFYNEVGICRVEWSYGKKQFWATE